MAIDTTRELTVLVGREAGTAEFEHTHATSDRVRILDANSVHEALYASRLVVFARASNLHELTHLVSTANKANRLRALLVDSDVEAEWLPYVFDRAKLRLLRNLLVHHGEAIPRRFLWAWDLGIQSQVIADATAIGEKLVVRNCALKPYEISFDAYPALSRIPPGERKNFDVDPDGLFLHWPSADVHLTMDDVLDDADPRRKEQALVRKMIENKALGAAIRAFRTECGLIQKNIEGMSVRHLSRIENGATPGDEALDVLAKAHGMDVDAYLEAILERME